MVSFNVYRSTASGAYVEGVCLATDEKPVVGIANGSILFAVDTESGETTRYMYDQNSMSWIEAACPCGGSGGSGGGSALPEVTAEDNGDVLTVVDGAWGKAAPSGGSGGALIVHLTGENLTADKTFGEIETALNNGIMVFFAQTTPIGFTQYGPIDTFSPGTAVGGFSAAFAFGSQAYSSQNADPTASDYPFFDGGAG